MGLDQYAGTIRTQTYEYTTPTGETKVDEYQTAGPFQWRKHARLQEFMNSIYMKRNKLQSKWETEEDSNGQRWSNPISWESIELKSEDIDELEKAINNGYSEYFCDGGFFWGHQFQEAAVKDYKEKDLEFVQFAREALADGETVVYECSW